MESTNMSSLYACIESLNGLLISYIGLFVYDLAWTANRQQSCGIIAHISDESLHQPIPSTCTDMGSLRVRSNYNTCN